MRVLVPDSRGLDQNFHDVTIVDMGDVLESSVSLQELSLLREQWPPAVFHHMQWFQQDLEVMRADAKKLGPGTVVAVPSVLVYGVERNAARLYGSCEGAHDVPWIVKTAAMEQFVPPWTVHRQVWSDSLKAGHSGISTDILLFSDINLSLVHHYRVHKRALPHIAFRKGLSVKVTHFATIAGG